MSLYFSLLSLHSHWLVLLIALSVMLGLSPDLFHHLGRWPDVTMVKLRTNILTMGWCRYNPCTSEFLCIALINILGFYRSWLIRNLGRPIELSLSVGSVPSRPTIYSTVQWARGLPKPRACDVFTMSPLGLKICCGMLLCRQQGNKDQAWGWRYQPVTIAVFINH